MRHGVFRIHRECQQAHRPHHEVECPRPVQSSRHREVRESSCIDAFSRRESKPSVHIPGSRMAGNAPNKNVRMTPIPIAAITSTPTPNRSLLSSMIVLTGYKMSSIR